MQLNVLSIVQTTYLNISHPAHKSTIVVVINRHKCNCSKATVAFICN